MTRLTICADAEAVAVRAAEEVVRHLRAARGEARLLHVALSGGRTPRRTYELLARSPAEWSYVAVWFADERCVAPVDEQSNYRMVAQSLLDPAGIAPERLHRMEGELGPEEGASRYEAALPGTGAGSPHHHLVCVQCRKVVDLHDAGLDDLQVSNPQGFEVHALKVQVEGICPECAGRRKSQRSVSTTSTASR